MEPSKQPGPRAAIPADRVLAVVTKLFGDDLHVKRVLSLANATLGAIPSGSLGVAVVGRGLAAARGIEAKHAIKQVDRLLSNMAIDVERLCDAWVPFAIGSREKAWVNTSTGPTSMPTTRPPSC